MYFQNQSQSIDFIFIWDRESIDLLLHLLPLLQVDRLHHLLELEQVDLLPSFSKLKRVDQLTSSSRASGSAHLLPELGQVDLLLLGLVNRLTSSSRELVNVLASSSSGTRASRSTYFFVTQSKWTYFFIQLWTKSINLLRLLPELVSLLLLDLERIDLLHLLPEPE